MLAELRREAQITIPNEIIAKLGLTAGYFRERRVDLHHAGSCVSEEIRQ